MATKSTSFVRLATSLPQLRCNREEVGSTRRKLVPTELWFRGEWIFIEQHMVTSTGPCEDSPRPLDGPLNQREEQSPNDGGGEHAQEPQPDLSTGTRLYPEENLSSVPWTFGGGCARRGPQHGQVAASALGSGRACPATVIAICPSCQCAAHPLSVRQTVVHPSTLPPLASLALRALLGEACILVRGHSLPVLL